MVNENQGFISHLSVTPNTRITDGADNIHSGIINTLNIATGGNRVVRGFDITQSDGGTYTKYTIGSQNWVLREGILTQVNNSSYVFQSKTSISTASWYAVLVVTSANALALREDRLANRVSALLADDIPVAIIEIAEDSDPDVANRRVQFLGYEQTNKGLSIIDDNTETLRINKEGTITKTVSGTETTVTIPATTGTLALFSQLPANSSNSVTGLMTNTQFDQLAANVTKLSGIEASANNFTLPTAAANTLGGIKVGSNLSINASGVLSAVNDDTQRSETYIQSVVGGMFSSNTETGINATYQSSDGTIDLELTTTDVDVSVSNLESRLAQINTATTIGNGVAITTGGDLTVTGNLTVSGETTTLNVTNLAIEDNTIMLNKNQTGNSSTDAGIEVERGNHTNVQLKWNETSNRWTFTNDGNNYFNIPVTSELANPYTHPNYTTSNLNTTGAVIIDNISTNNTGHITSMGTRTLSLADLGYTGTANANTYVHPNHSGDVTSSADGATTIGANKVTTAKINNSAVTTSKIADNAITNVKIDSNAAIAQSKISGLVSALSGKEPTLTISDGLDRTGATLTLDITGLSNENGIDRTADFVAFHDNTVGLRKVNLENIFSKLTASDIPSLSGAYRAVGTTLVDADISNSAAISADKIAAGTNNKLFTSTLEAKLSGVDAGAEVNVNADWNSGSGDSQILNKPTIPSGNQIIDWTSNGAGTIHASNYSNTEYTVGDGGLSQKNFTTALYDKLVSVAANANNFSLTTGAVTNAHLAGSIANSKLDAIAQSKVTGLTTALNSKIENLGDLSITASATELNILDGVSGVSSTEIGYLDGVTSSIQTQLNSKLSTLALTGLSDVSVYNTSIDNSASGSGLASTLAIKTYVDSKSTVDTTYTLTSANGSDDSFKTITLADNTGGAGSVVHLMEGTGITIARNAVSDTLTISSSAASVLSKSTLTPVLASYDGTETLNIGDTGNDTTVNIRGNLNVLGTTTTLNKTEIDVQDALVFSYDTGSDAKTSTLRITDPTDNRIITIPDISGTLLTSSDSGTISSAMIASTAVISAKIGTNAVLTSKINASAVTTAKLASNAVTNAKLADDAVQTDSIADGAVTVGKITGLTDLGSGTVISSAERTKLTNIELSADVTDATNVTAAGAVMDGDFTSNGLMKRIGAGSYTVDNSSYLTSLSVTGLSDINAFDLDLSSVSGSHDSLASAKAIKTYVDSSVSGAGSFSSFNIKDGVGTTVNVTDGKFVQFTQGTGITATWTDTNSGASTDPFDLTLVNTGVLSNVAGTGIGVSGTTGNVTVTNTDLGSAQHIFKNIAVSGQSNIVANSNNDTLTFVGGSNVTLTTTAGSDSITITATDTDTHLTQEEVEDYVGGLISAGSNISVQYADNAGSAGSLIITGTANDDVSIDNLKTRLNSDFGGDYTIGSQADDTLTVSGSLTVGADLIVSGDTITMNTSTLTVEDPLIALGSNNAADAVDLGFYGKYVDGSTIKYAGLFRDTSDSNKWKLFTDTGNTHAAPTTTINTTSGFTLGTLVASTFEGGLVGNATTATTLLNARTIAGVSFNGSTNITIPINNLTGTLTAANGGTGLTSISTLLNSNVSLAVADLSDVASLDTDISSVSSSDDTLASAKAIKTYVDAQFSGAGTGDMTGVDITAGTGITVSQSNTTAGNYTATIGVAGLSVAQLAGSALQISTESFNNNDTSLMSSAAIEDKILSYGYGVGTGDGDITSVVAGVGLSGGATTGDATLNLDFSELTDMTGDIAGTTEFIIQDGTTESRKAASEIKLSYFNNDSNWNNYVHPTGAGNNHIPTGGSAGQFLKYSSSGTASWATPSYTTEEQIEDFIAAMITAGTNITSTYDDTAGTLTLSSTDTNTQLSDAQVIAKTLTGLSTATGGAVASSDSILVAFGKLEKRVALNDAKTTNSDTTYSEATSSDLGLVKIGYTESGKNYPVELLSGQMFVNVPWTDTNTNLTLLNDGGFSANSATSAASQQSIKTYVDTSVANLVASAPSALDTLNELAVALQSNDSDITGITTALGNRLRIDVNNQGLSSTQQGYALDNLGITASLAELNILASGLSASDIPNIGAGKITSGTLSRNTTGTAAGLSSTLAISSGGTGATSAPMIGVVTAANVGAARTVLGLGTASTLSGTGAVSDGNAGLVTGDVVFDYIAAQGFASSGASNFVAEDITGQTALTSGLASTDELVLSDAGTLKRMGISVLQSYMQNALTFTSDTQRSAGALLDLNGNALDVDLSELTDMTESWVAGEDEFVVLDNGVQKRKLSSELFGSNAFNSTAYLTAHPNINAANSVDNSSRTYIQDITLDSNGHITGIVSATETVTDSGNTTYGISAVDGDNADEEKIRLTDSASGTDDVVLEAGAGLSVARSGDKITFTNTSPNVSTNLGITGTTGARTITSSDGTDAIIPIATSATGTNLSGVMTPTMFDKLNDIEASATADQTASEITALLDNVASYTLGTNAGTITVGNDLTVIGDLLVSGDTVTINTATLDVKDLNITVGKDATTSSATNGAGLTFGAWTSGTIPTLTWVHADSRLAVNKSLYSSGGFVGALTGNVTGNATTATNLAGTTTATHVYAGPTTGNAAAPAFRALVAGDIPDLSGTYSTSDTVDMGDGFKLRDDDDDDVTITENKYIKFTAATGTAGTNVTGTGTTGDPYVMAITLPNDTIANTFRTVTVDTNGDGTADNTLGGTETLMLKKGSNITLAEADGVVTISSADTVYTHPTHDGDDISIDTSGASVIDTLTITTNTLGHVTDASATTRTLSLSDLSFTGDADATDDQTAVEIIGLFDSNLGGDFTIGNQSDDTATFTGHVSVGGNLTVTGTVTTSNVETVSTSNGVIFEGTGNAATEITLKGGTVSGDDKTITLPNADGTVALTTQLHDAVTLANTNYLSISGQSITGGTVPVASGGTGSTTAPMVGVITAANASAARTVLELGGLATLNSVAAGQIDANAVDSSELNDGSIDESHLNVSNAAGSGTDNYLLSYNHAGSNFTWVAPVSSGIALSDLSIGAEGTPSGNGGLAFNNSTGVITYTPAVNITGTSGDATAIAITDHTNTNENNKLTFVANGSGAGSGGSARGLEVDADLHYNPSTRKLTSANFAGALVGNVTGNVTGALLSVNNNDISITPNGTGKVSRRNNPAITTQPDTGDAASSNTAQSMGITKIVGSSNPLSGSNTTANNASFTIPNVLPTGGVSSGVCDFRGIKGTIHIDAGLANGNFVMTQDFIANDRYGNGTFEYLSYGMVHEGISNFPFEVSWSPAEGDDMVLKVANRTGADVTSAIKVYWDLTLFPKA